MEQAKKKRGKMKLSDIQKETLRRYHLGGIGALRTNEFMASCKTIDSLIRHGYLDKNGLTEKGQITAKKLADENHLRIVGATP